MYKKPVIFIAACCGMLLFGICLVTLGSVAPGLKDKFGLNQFEAGTLFSILPVGILLGSLLFGPFSDKYGYKTFLVISSLSMFAGFQGIAFSSSLLLLKISAFIFGFGGGAINGATNAVVADISTNQNKGANLSLLGVFFAVGALGMPSVLGVLNGRFNFHIVVSMVGLLALITAVFFMLLQFPPPKQKTGVPLTKGIGLLKDSFLLLTGFFLFCQSSFEGLINNWTTIYLINQLSISHSTALYALSLYVTGMAVMRLLLGSVFRKTSPAYLLYGSFTLLLAGSLLLKTSDSFWQATSGLILIGAGLAGGFPIMLGFAGNRYNEISGTAFSLILVIALTGNMLINFLMGIIAQAYGIGHLTTLILAETVLLSILAVSVLKRINNKSYNNF